MNMPMSKIVEAQRILLPPGSVRTQAECLAAVQRLGMLWAFTPGNCLLPSLFPALDTQSEHERWEWVWGWKDRLSGRREAYYGRVVGGKPTLVSMEWLPRLYALTGNCGDLADDLLHVAEAVRLTEIAVRVCRFLQESGPTGTRTLIAQLTDGSKGMRSALDKALHQLDTAMLIVKCGTEGGNSIANVWDLFPRFLPEAVEAGTEIPTREAAVLLFRLYFSLTPAGTRRSLEGVFPWNRAHQERALVRLEEAGELVACTVDGKPGLRRADFGL